jgi:hypothetical protein
LLIHDECVRATPLPPLVNQERDRDVELLRERREFELERALERARPDPPGFFPPPSCLFTVAHARRSASRDEIP